MYRLVPSGPQRHPWNGHSTQSSTTVPPWPMCAPRCLQCASKTCSSPDLSRYATRSSPKYWRGRASPTANSADHPTMNHPVTFQVNGTLTPSAPVVVSLILSPLQYRFQQV